MYSVSLGWPLWLVAPDIWKVVYRLWRIHAFTYVKTVRSWRFSMRVDNSVCRSIVSVWCRRTHRLVVSDSLFFFLLLKFNVMTKCANNFRCFGNNGYHGLTKDDRQWRCSRSNTIDCYRWCWSVDLWTRRQHSTSARGVSHQFDLVALSWTQFGRIGRHPRCITAEKWWTTVHLYCRFNIVNAGQLAGLTESSSCGKCLGGRMCIATDFD